MKIIKLLIITLLTAALMISAVSCNDNSRDNSQSQGKPDGFQGGQVGGGILPGGGYAPGGPAPGIDLLPGGGSEDSGVESDDKDSDEDPDKDSDKDSEDGKDEDSDNGEDNNDGDENGYVGTFVVGTEYYTGESIANVNNSINLLYLEEGGRFSLDMTSIGGVGITFVTEKSGVFEYDGDTGIYTLYYDLPTGSVAYGRVDGTVFLFCNEDGSDIATVNGRGGDGVTEVDYIPRVGNSSYGYYDLAKNENGRAMQRFYYDLYLTYESFYESDEDILPNGDGKYIFAELPFADYGITVPEAISVWKIFGLENPAYYYYMSTATVDGDNLVLYISELYANAEDRRRCESDIEAMIAECGGLLSDDMSELITVMTIHDYIMKEINYAYRPGTNIPEDADWAHNITGVASVKSGVCESYAKTFSFLCDIYGIEAITVSGYGGEPHAWNLASVGGDWYSFDLTWNDTGDDSKLSYSCFGQSFSNVTASHTHDTPDEYGLKYLYDLPLISNTDIQLITLYENGTELGFFVSIDDAFAHMTRADGDYVIEFMDYENSGPLLISVPEIKHYIFAERTPDVRSITFSGIVSNSHGGYATFLPLYFVNTNGFTVTCDLRFEGADLQQPSLKFPGIFLDGGRLILGTACQSQLSFIGNTSEDDTESEIRIVGGGIIYSDIDVHNVIIDYSESQDAGIQLRGNLRIDYLEGRNIDLHAAFVRKTGYIGCYKAVGSYSSFNVTNYDLTVGDIQSDMNVAFHLEMGEFDVLPFVSLEGDANQRIEVSINTFTTMIETDLNGTLIDEYTKYIDPYTITPPFVKINESIDPALILLYFIDWSWAGSGTFVEMTDYFYLSEDMTFTIYDLSFTDDGFVLAGDLLLKYQGDDPSPTIPAGITRIGRYAFIRDTPYELLVIPEGVTFIGDHAFEYCYVKELVLPSTLEHFEKQTLYIFPEENSAVTFNGTVRQWRLIVFRSLGFASFTYSYIPITCTDGSVQPISGFMGSYNEHHIGADRYYEYTEDGLLYDVYYTFNYGDDGTCTIDYTLYGESSMGCMTADTTFTYDADTGVYTVTYEDGDVYLKILDTGCFIFCDADGTATETHPLVKAR